MTRPEQDLIAPGGPGGVLGLALMSEEQFEARLAALKIGQERVRRIQLELMVGPTKENPEGEDYGTIPGTKKPTLYKPGAEKMCKAYNLVATFEETWIEGDGETSPSLRCRMKCLLHVGNSEGPVVGEGVGAANSWERKHRYRATRRACPSCGSEGTIRKSKYPDKQTGDIGWWCRDENCKVNFRSDDPAIVGQVSGEVQNKDPYDTENTLLKMAKKRSHVDATLTATATSGLFAQDLEDMEHGDVPTGPAPKANGTPATPPPAQREPGSDDDDERQAREAYERAGVDPPAKMTAPPASGAGRNGIPPCPKGHPAAKVMHSKRGPGYYCHACGEGFQVPA